MLKLESGTFLFLALAASRVGTARFPKFGD